LITNKERALNGDLPALSENAKLDAAAKAKVEDMFQKQYFEHISPSGKGPSDLAKEVNYEYALIGENLALGDFKNNQALLDAWMKSPGHRANILNKKFTEMGAAAEQGIYNGEKTWLAVQEFGEPLSNCPAVDVTLRSQIDTDKNDLDAKAKALDQKKAEIDSTYPKYGDAYNSQVSEYNSMLAAYNAEVNQVKAEVDRYNAEVRAYNTCIAQ
jgi:hypothetical protein